MTREKILQSPAYWFEYEQNELYRQVTEYLERENINQTELAERLNVNKSYISQILNGNFNYTLKKLIEISLAIGVVPRIKYNKLDEVIKEDNLLKSYYNSNLSVAKERIIPLAIANIIGKSVDDERENEKIGINSFTQYKRNKIQDISFKKEDSDLVLVA